MRANLWKELSRRRAVETASVGKFVADLWQNRRQTRSSGPSSDQTDFRNTLRLNEKACRHLLCLAHATVRVRFPAGAIHPSKSSTCDIFASCVGKFGLNWPQNRA